MRPFEAVALAALAGAGCKTEPHSIVLTKFGALDARLDAMCKTHLVGEAIHNRGAVDDISTQQQDTCELEGNGTFHVTRRGRYGMPDVGEVCEIDIGPDPLVRDLPLELVAAAFDGEQIRASLFDDVDPASLDPMALGYVDLVVGTVSIQLRWYRGDNLDYLFQAHISGCLRATQP